MGFGSLGSMSTRFLLGAAPMLLLSWGGSSVESQLVTRQGINDFFGRCSRNRALEESEEPRGSSGSWRVRLREQRPKKSSPWHVTNCHSGFHSAFPFTVALGLPARAFHSGASTSHVRLKQEKKVNSRVPSPRGLLLARHRTRRPVLNGTAQTGWNSKQELYLGTASTHTTERPQRNRPQKELLASKRLMPLTMS